MLLLRQTSKALSHPSTHLARQHARHLYQTPPLSTLDPRLASYGRVIQDDYATLRDRYTPPRHPIILAHGLFGFDELHLPLTRRFLPGLQYWRGIKQALAAQGITVLTASVPASASIEARAARLARTVTALAAGRSVNIVAHSMGGLDARYMLAVLRPAVDVRSLTTIATPHRGSHVADELLKRVGPVWRPRVYGALERVGVATGAFGQLSAEYMREVFNEEVRDVEGVRYLSYGAAFEPGWMSVFRRSHRLLKEAEGENDGLVSVESSRWGEYKGTLVGVSHLDLINWTNRLKWWMWGITGHQRKFNAIAFYLDIADMLAKEGL